jgi:RNA polymerase sigma-70 factor (ECF subfamily)
MAAESTALLQHWLDRHAAGDPGAREELIGHSQERLRRLTRQMLQHYSRLRRWEDTSDVLQNVLMRLGDALRGATTLATPHDLLCFAAALIRHELIDLSRHYFGPQGEAAHHASPPVAGPQAPRPEPADQSNDPYRLALWHELHLCIARLPDEDRALFEVLYYQGLTQLQAAELLGVPLRTLKRRWQQARLRLMERFGGNLPL